MTATQTYWRDNVTTLLRWGAALVVLLSGWAIDHHDAFYFGGERDKHIAAIGLLFAAIVFAILLPWSIHKLYQRFLTIGIDDTVLARRFALACAYALSLSAFGVAFLMACF